MPRSHDVSHVRSDLASFPKVLSDSIDEAFACQHFLGRDDRLCFASRVLGSEPMALAARDSGRALSEMPLYVIDTDVLRVAMDVLCSTGPQPDWYGLVPLDALFVWDSDDLADAAPVIMQWGANVGGEECWAHMRPSGVMLLRDRMAGLMPSCRAHVPRGYAILRDTPGSVPTCRLEGDDADRELPWSKAMVISRILMEGGERLVRHYTRPVEVVNPVVRAAYEGVERRVAGSGRWWLCGGANDHVRPFLNCDVRGVRYEDGTDVPLGGLHWCTDANTLAKTAEMAKAHFGDGLDGYDSVWIHVLACVFGLLGHPELVGSTDVPELGHLSRQQRRRLQRDGTDVDALLRRRVTTIHLREQPARPSSDAEGHRDVQYGCRWIVHGHYTHQPCGPNRSERRLTWIAPYIKGPAGKPLKSDLERTVNVTL